MKNCHMFRATNNGYACDHVWRFTTELKGVLCEELPYVWNFKWGKKAIFSTGKVARICPALLFCVAY